MATLRNAIPYTVLDVEKTGKLVDGHALAEVRRPPLPLALPALTSNTSNACMPSPAIRVVYARAA